MGDNWEVATLELIRDKIGEFEHLLQIEIKSIDEERIFKMLRDLLDAFDSARDAYPSLAMILSGIRMWTCASNRLLEMYKRDKEIAFSASHRLWLHAAQIRGFSLATWIQLLEIVIVIAGKSKVHVFAFSEIKDYLEKCNLSTSDLITQLLTYNNPSSANTDDATLSDWNELLDLLTAEGGCSYELEKRICQYISVIPESTMISILGENSMFFPDLSDNLKRIARISECATHDFTPDEMKKIKKDELFYMQVLPSIFDRLIEIKKDHQFPWLDDKKHIEEAFKEIIEAPTSFWGDNPCIVEPAIACSDVLSFKKSGKKRKFQTHTMLKTTESKKRLIVMSMNVLDAPGEQAHDRQVNWDSHVNDNHSNRHVRDRQLLSPGQSIYMDGEILYPSLIIQNIWNVLCDMKSSEMTSASDTFKMVTLFRDLANNLIDFDARHQTDRLCRLWLLNKHPTWRQHMHQMGPCFATLYASVSKHIELICHQTILSPDPLNLCEKFMIRSPMSEILRCVTPYIRLKGLSHFKTTLTDMCTYVTGEKEDDLKCEYCTNLLSGNATTGQCENPRIFPLDLNHIYFVTPTRRHNPHKKRLHVARFAYGGHEISTSEGMCMSRCELYHYESE